MAKKIDVTDIPASEVKTEVLIAWLYQAAKGGVQPMGMRRLCWLSAEKLTDAAKGGS